MHCDLYFRVRIEVCLEQDEGANVRVVTKKIRKGILTKNYKNA